MQAASAETWRSLIQQEIIIQQARSAPDANLAPAEAKGSTQQQPRLNGKQKPEFWLQRLPVASGRLTASAQVPGSGLNRDGLASVLRRPPGWGRRARDVSARKSGLGERRTWNGSVRRLLEGLRGKKETPHQAQKEGPCKSPVSCPWGPQGLLACLCWGQGST